MSFEIGKKCEGLHEGRWYVCTILSCEKDGYSVTFGVESSIPFSLLNLFARALRLTVGRGSLDSKHKFQQAPSR